MKLFGSTAELTALAQLIMDENIEVLDDLFSKGFDINAVFTITEHIEELPITLALCENKEKVIHWLLSKNVNLNDPEYPAILMACSNCDAQMLQLLINKGANVNAKHRIGSTAMSDALYGNNDEVIPLLIESGYDLKNDGVSLRQAVDNRQYKAIQLFLDYGIDVNHSKPNMVFPYNSTPVHIASQNNDLDTVKLLVKHGADVTIKDKYGARAYNCAVENNNEEMKLFIASLEPKQWHNEEQRLIDLKQYKIPKALMNILRSENRKIELPTNQYTRFIVFNSLLDIKEVHWKKHKFLDLLSDADNYSPEGFLVWYPKKKCFAFADYEHGEFIELSSVAVFLENPSAQIDKIFESLGVPFPAACGVK